MTLNILSYNVFGSPFYDDRIIRSFLRTRVRKRFRHIAQGILQEKIDILLFQEVHTYPHFFILRRALKKYKYVSFQPGVFGPNGGLVIFSNLPLEKRRYQDFFNKGVWWNKSVTGPLTQKGMLFCKIKNRDIWIINTHLTQNSSQKWQEENKSFSLLKSQLEQCIKLVTRLQAKGNQIICAGDFNLPHTLSLYQKFIDETGLKDSFQDALTPTYHTIFKGLDKSGRIDYIFYSKSIKFKESKYMFTEPLRIKENEELLLSDHIALNATLSLL